jgi:glyoxylase-like metal-dependent hydrolase (beta-lactamase superfamily II)
MHVHHLNCGTMCPLSARLVNGRGGLLEPARMVCHCLLVEGNDGLVLVDTGLGTQDVRDPRSRLGGVFVRVTRPRLSVEETALAQVQRLGFSPTDVRHIVPTHLDLDHVGGLSDFPEAAVHVFEKEHAAAMARRTAKEKNRYRPVQIAHGPRWRIHGVGGDRWFGFESVRVLGDGDDAILLVPLVGHTRGHCGVAVRSGGRWILHAGDAYFARGEVHDDAPRCPPALEWFQSMMEMDRRARLANRRRLRELARAHGGEVTVLSAHSPEELDRAIGALPS